ncbi:DMT family transporter [Acidiferrobacter sp.]|uniref:DMT family transporter n=1 Tax=Acidiferrobacter sp. TaxID=1872107 RepID=UPI002612B57A|nr:DMT family transporter [Acidiferrobacter sp.]
MKTPAVSSHPHRGIVSALAAAVLFGASIPLAKGLLGLVSAVVLAGLLYLGAGMGLALVWSWRRARRAETGTIARGDWPWLAGAVACGGVFGPLLLLYGLARMPAASASLLLNLENVFTALMAWFVFHEHRNRRIVGGMALIVFAGGLLAAQGPVGLASVAGPLAIVAACLCWAADNNLTRQVASGDPVLIAAVKGLAAGGVNVLAAVWLGEHVPSRAVAAAAGLVGFIGYGASLALFVRALRDIGTVRASGYFAVAPFAGALLALVWRPENEGVSFWAAAGLMASGVWLYLTERHVHSHHHPGLTHSHEHGHDAHHLHGHDFPWDGWTPHVHRHTHEPLTHSHAHYPDIHHRHGHE